MVPTAEGVQIYSHDTGFCIGVESGGSAVSGAPIEIQNCADVAWQKWVAKPDGTLRSQGKCMNVGGGSTADGAPVSWTNCNGTPAQQFVLNSSNDLVNSHADKCLDVGGRSPGTNLQIWSCAGTDNQKWSSR